MKYLLTLSDSYIAADEVGRGCFAGPLVVGILRLPKRIGNIASMIKDSKKLTPKRRLLIARILKQKAYFSLGLVSNIEVDNLGLTKATNLAIERAIYSFKIFYPNCKIETLYLDGIFDYGFKGLTKTCTIVKGDTKFIEIALAAIYAKIYRDEIMNLYCPIFSKYKFSNNVGYGTKNHIESLLNFGSTRIHRNTFLKKINEKKNFSSR